MAEIVPIVDEGLGNSAYLLGLGDGRALAVDPSRDPRPYLAAAEQRGWRIAYTVDTHLHADFVSGSRELAALGARVLAPAAADVGFGAQALRDGDRFHLGDLVLEVLATPGHTPEHLSYLVSESGRPAALFSGGTLIVGGSARPDLLGPEQTESLARAAYRSMRDRFLALPDDLVVHPTHGAGSFCSTASSEARATTIGEERNHNPLLAAADEDDFVARLLSRLGGYPPYFLKLRQVNRDGPAVYGVRPPALARLPVDRFQAAVEAGAEVVDARPIAAFARAHLPRALSNTLRAQFAVWLGWLVGIDRPLAFVCDEQTDRDRLASECRKIGAEHLVGELDGGVAAWREAGGVVEETVLVDAADLDVHRPVLDVRQDPEWRDAHAPGALHVELGRLRADVGSLPDGALVVHCAHGERAMTAASLLARAGRRDVQVLAGGAQAWSRAAGDALVTG